MKLKYYQKKNYGVLEIEGRLDASNVAELKSQFDEFIKETKYFIFNLEKLEFIDSTGLGGLISCLRKTLEIDGEIKIACLQPKPRMVFEITRANRVFGVYDDVETALESYAIAS